MKKPGLGRPRPPNKYFANKALIKNEQMRARAAKSPKLTLLDDFSNKPLAEIE